MRLVTVAFSSAGDFVKHYSDAYPNGALFCRTRATLSLREAVLLEISFPGLPNRALVRGTAVSLKHGSGAWVRFSRDDRRTGEFVFRCAQGEIPDSDRVERIHRRFPTELPVACRIDEADALTAEQQLSLTHDLGAGGAFIRSQNPPPVGTRVALTIGPDEQGQQFAVDGRVAWVRQEAGFGVRFDPKGDHDTARLRIVLRRASETGRLGLSL